MSGVNEPPKYEYYTGWCKLNVDRIPYEKTYEMTDQEAKSMTLLGWDLVFQQGAMIAELPIEEWLEAFDKAEIAAPILDPTLYLKYLYSGKGELIKAVLRAALAFKQAILNARDQVKADPRLAEVE